jgi:hypothetical protein
MDKENVVSTHNRVLFTHREEQNYVIYWEMDGTGDHHARQNKPDSESPISSFLLCGI